MVDTLIYVVCVYLDAGICYHHLFTVRYQYAPSTPQCVRWSSIWCAYQFDVRFNKHLKTIWLPQWNEKSRELNSVSNLKLLYNKIHIIYWSVSSTAKVSYQRVIGILIALGIIWLIKYSDMEWFRHHLLSAAYWDQGAVSIRKTVLLGMVIPMLKIRRPTGRLIFNMGIPIPGKTVFYIETGPCYEMRRWNITGLRTHWNPDKWGISMQVSTFELRNKCSYNTWWVTLLSKARSHGLFAKSAFSFWIYLTISKTSAWFVFANGIDEDHINSVASTSAGDILC